MNLDDDFSYLDCLEPKLDKTIEHVMEGVPSSPTDPTPIKLRLAFAGRGSRFWNASLARTKLTDERAESMAWGELLARFAIVGWEAAGRAYSTEAVTRLLHKLIQARRDEKVMAVYLAAANPDNFTDHPAPQAGDLGKP